MAGSVGAGVGACIVLERMLAVRVMLVKKARANSTSVMCLYQPIKLRSGSRMMLPSSRPLRTARARFRACSLKPFERPLQDAVSQQIDLGCGFVGDSWGAGAFGFLRRLIRLLISRGCDGSAIP